MEVAEVEHLLEQAARLGRRARVHRLAGLGPERTGDGFGSRGRAPGFEVLRAANCQLRLRPLALL
jgi:hypothetical protein